MSKLKTTIIIFVLPILLIFLVYMVRGETNNIVISGAHSSNTFSISSSAALLNEIRQTPSNIIVQFTDGSWRHKLPPMASELAIKLEQVPRLPALQFADSGLVRKLPPVSGELRSVLKEVPSHVMLQFVEGNGTWATTYPRILMDDNTPPSAGPPTAGPWSNNSMILVWNSNEFARSTLNYGTISNQYDKTVTDDLFKKYHEMIVTGLEPDTIYYYRITQTDRSGNEMRSKEYKLELQVNNTLFLPMIVGTE